MAIRIPLLVKKRGVRSTSPSTLGHWSELLVSLFMAIVGGTALVLHVTQVLIPEWRRSLELDELQPTRCRILDKRVETNSILGGTEYAPSLKVELLVSETPPPPVWTIEGLGSYSPQREVAEHVLAQYTVGDIEPCWYDPIDSDPIVLGRRFRWWPWPVALLPASLLAVGVWGVAASLLQVTTSAERRSLVSQRVQQLDPLASATTETGVELSSSYENPGIRLAYRLPADASTNWRLLGMFLVTALWNTLLVYFAYTATLSWMRGNPRWLASWLILGLGSVGIWLAFQLVRELWLNRRIGTTQVEVSHHPLILGGSARVFLQQSGRGKLNHLAVELVCEEQAVFRQGTDSRQWVECVHREQLRRWRRLMIESGLPFEGEFTLQVPADAMHSFVAPHSQVRWLLVVRGAARRRRTFERRFPVDIQPAELAAVLPGDSMVTEALR